MSKGGYIGKAGNYAAPVDTTGMDEGMKKTLSGGEQAHPYAGGGLGALLGNIGGGAHSHDRGDAGNPRMSPSVQRAGRDFGSRIGEAVKEAQSEVGAVGEAISRTPFYGHVYRKLASNVPAYAKGVGMVGKKAVELAEQGVTKGAEAVKKIVKGKK